MTPSFDVTRVFTVAFLMLPVTAVVQAQSSVDPVEVTNQVTDQEAELVKRYEEQLRSLDQAFRKRIGSIRKDAAKKLKQAQDVVAATDLDRAIEIRKMQETLLAAPIKNPALPESLSQEVKTEELQTGNADGQLAEYRKLRGSLKALQARYSHLQNEQCAVYLHRARVRQKQPLSKLMVFAAGGVVLTKAGRGKWTLEGSKLRISFGAPGGGEFELSSDGRSYGGKNRFGEAVSATYFAGAPIHVVGRVGPKP